MTGLALPVADAMIALPCLLGGLGSAIKEFEMRSRTTEDGLCASPLLLFNVFGGNACCVF